MLKAVQLDPTAHPGAMIALMLTLEQQAQIKELAPFSAGADHCTLIYLADDAGTLLEQKPQIVEALAAYCAGCAPLSIPLNGYGRFVGDEESYPAVLLLDSQCLAEIQSCLCACCGVEPASAHGFTPHITLAYVPTGEPLPALEVPPISFDFATISLIWGGERIDIPLLGNTQSEEGDLEIAAIVADAAIDEYAERSFAALDTENSATLIPEEQKVDDTLSNDDEEDDPSAVAHLASDTVKSLPYIFASDSTKWISAADDFVIRIPGVRWGGKDLVGDTFTRDTDIGRDRSFIGMPAYYDHAQGGIKSQIGKVVDVEEDDEGIDFLIELDRSRRYVADVLALYQKKALGGSTGAPSHTVLRSGGTLKRWIISEISPTPTPAEPRNHAALKSTMENNTMADETSVATEDIGALKGEAVALRAEVTALRTELNELKALPAVQKQRTAQEAAADLGGAIGGGMNARAGEAGSYHNFKAMKALSYPGRPTLQTMYPEGVFGGYVKALFNMHKADPSLQRDAMKAMSEMYGVDLNSESAKSLGTQAGISGAYLLAEQFVPNLMQIAQQQDVLYGKTMVIPVESGEVVIPALDYTSAFVEGQSAYYGGVTVTWGDDDASTTDTQPKFGQVRLKTNAIKLSVRIKNQLMMRSAISIDAVVSNLVGGAIARARDYAILRGTGQGQPLGVLNSPAAIDVAGSAIDFSTLAGMEDNVIPERDAGYIWVIHTKKRSAVYALQQTNNTLVTFLPDLRGKPQAVLLGREIAWTDKTPFSSSDVSNTVNLIDPSMIVVAEYQGIAMAVSDQARFEQDETVIRVIMSMDAQPWMKSKIQVASSGDSTKDYVSGFITI